MPRISGISKCAARGATAQRGSASAERADLEHFAVVTGLLGNAELAPTIELGHHGHHRDDRLVLHLLERGSNIGLLAEPDQVARGRERQLEAPAFTTLQRFARRPPE